MTTIKILLAWLAAFFGMRRAPALTIGPAWITTDLRFRGWATRYNAIRRLQARPDYCALVKARDRRKVRASYGSRARLPLVSIGGGL